MLHIIVSGKLSRKILRIKIKYCKAARETGGIEGWLVTVIIEEP